MSAPAISVIVPVWNDQARIGLCIKALQRQTLAPEEYEIIVVDNGSSDGTAAVVEGCPGVILLREPRAGSYAARNTGLAHARGEYVAFTDSDCLPRETWLATGLSAIRTHPDVGVVAGSVEFMEPEGPYSRACLNYERYLSMRQDENAEKGVAITANWFSRKDVLLGRGGFNAVLKSGGDHALSKQLSQSGLRVLYVAEAVVRHPARARIAEITGKARRIVGGKWATENGPLKALKRAKVETRNLADRTRAIMRAKLPLGEKLEVSGLLLRIWLLSLAELVRLQFGGSPARS